MSITVFLMQEALQALFSIVLDGAKALIDMKAQVRQKLVRVYLEIKTNITAIEQAGCLYENKISVEDKTFVSMVKALRNKEIKQLYDFDRKRMFFPNTKNEVKRRKTQYAINHVVTKIDSLQTIVKLERNAKAPSLRLGIQIRTLHKHLKTLEKALSPLDSKKKSKPVPGTKKGVSR